MKNFWKIFAIVAAVLVSDLLTKGYLLYLVSGQVPLTGAAFSLAPYPYIIPGFSTDFFNLVFTWNTGTAFSLFRSIGEFSSLIIIVITGLIIGFLGNQLLFRTKRPLEIWGLSLIVGGALGNLIDRIRFGAVVDFLDFHVSNWHWPAFNVADIAICIGVGLYILHWVVDKKGK
ncbi:hypothetical protein FACS18945_3120 [Bacteroidia bacterium]|nr:hypothetical protein FACS18945_3120 [Bacteroidia bacterium]